MGLKEANGGSCDLKFPKRKITQCISNIAPSVELNMIEVGLILYKSELNRFFTPGQPDIFKQVQIFGYIIQVLVL
jgi:hypothetical protein